MTQTATATVRAASWQDDLRALQSLRREVFILEQGVPETLEWDEHDAVSLHALALGPAGRPVGTGRLLPDGHIGRIAVLRDWRSRGVGSAILRFLIEQGQRRGLQSFRLHAQTHALAFYERHGFIAEGNVFKEAGIPHRQMTLSLKPSGTASPA
jgi:predicted GNAT family N-acyltransferase